VMGPESSSLVMGPGASRTRPLAVAGARTQAGSQSAAPFGQEEPARQRHERLKAQAEQRLVQTYGRRSTGGGRGQLEGQSRVVAVGAEPSGSAFGSESQTDARPRSALSPVAPTAGLSTRGATPSRANASRPRSSDPLRRPAPAVRRALADTASGTKQHGVFSSSMADAVGDEPSRAMNGSSHAAAVSRAMADIDRAALRATVTLKHGATQEAEALAASASLARPGSAAAAGSGSPIDEPLLSPATVPEGLVESIVSLEQSHAEVALAADRGRRLWLTAERLSQRHAAFGLFSASMRRYRRAVLDVVARIREWQGLALRPAWDVDQPAADIAEEAQQAVQNATLAAATAPPFYWRGRKLLPWVVSSLDFLAELPELREWLGAAFPLVRNPLGLPASLDSRPPPLRATVRRVRVAGCDELRMDAALARERAAATKLRQAWWGRFRPSPAAATAVDVLDQVEEDAMRTLAQGGAAGRAPAAVVAGRHGALGPAARKEQERLSVELVRAQSVAQGFSKSRTDADTAALAIEEASGDARRPWKTAQATSVMRAARSPVKAALVAAGRVAAGPHDIPVNPGKLSSARASSLSHPAPASQSPALSPLFGGKPGTPDMRLTTSVGGGCLEPPLGDGRLSSPPPKVAPLLPLPGSGHQAGAASPVLSDRTTTSDSPPVQRDRPASGRLRAFVRTGFFRAAVAMMANPNSQSEASAAAERAWAARADAARTDGTVGDVGSGAARAEDLDQPLPPVANQPGEHTAGMPRWWPCSLLTRREIAACRACEACLLDAEMLGL